MDDYISKPINQEELRALVGRIAKRKEPRLPVDARTGALDSLEVLNLDRALAQIEGDKGLLAEIFQIFRETEPQLLDEIRRAVSGSKSQSVAGTAHFLVSSLGQLGAQRASAAGKKLEKLAETGKMFEVPDALAELERELAQLKSALSDHNDFTQS
jgi:HPt (histidine-containing phosphotransfer) domain-containing protein